MYLVLFLYHGWDVLQLSLPGLLFCTATHHVEEQNDAEVDADCRPRGRPLRVVSNERPAKGGEGADSDHTVNDDAKYSCDHHQDLWHHSERKN